MFATPALRALRKVFPKARIVVLARSGIGEILENNPWALEIVALGSNRELLRELLKIRQTNYDLALGLSEVGSYCCRKSGAKVKVDFGSVSYVESCSVVDLCLAVVEEGLRLLDYPVADFNQKTECWVNATETSLITELIKLKKGLIALHCGGQCFIRKQWPVDNFVQLLRQVNQKWDWQTVLIGGKDDEEWAGKMQQLVPETMSVVGKLNLSQTAALLLHCQLMIGNDSGPLHLAAALGIPTIGLFGPTSPQQFYPYDSTKHHFLYKSFPCSPCYKFGGPIYQRLTKCSQPYCMEAINPDEVMALIESSLGSNASN